MCDANGQSLAYVYSRENPNDAHMAKLLTEDEARRIASNIAKLPDLLANMCGIGGSWRPPGDSGEARSVGRPHRCFTSRVTSPWNTS